MPTFLDHESFCENLPEVTSTKIFARKKFHPEGLFSEQIFGPIKNYTCQCNVYHGPSREGITCEDCGVPILEARTRREKFAKISLPIQILNPVFYDMLKEIGKSSVTGPLDELVKNENSVLFIDEDGHYVIDTGGNTPDNTKVWDRLDAVYELVKGISERNYDKDERWKYIYDNIDKLLISEIIVLPPELRPSSAKTSINELDEINRYYMQILTKKEVMQNTLINIQRDKELFYQYFRQVQKNVNDLYEQILAKLSKKEGLIRGHILGKRIDFSGRSVIAPGAYLDIDSCQIPYTMYLELFKLEVSKKLIELGKFKLLNNAIDFVDECIKYEKPVLFDLCKELIQSNNDVCILNRQPSLHRLSMMAFYVDISLEHVIRLHPLACPGYNADFDGDSLDAKTTLGIGRNKITTQMEDVLDLNVFQYKSEKVKNDGTKITKYSPTDKVRIKSIDPQTGETSWKNVSEFSVHENLNMYQVEDPENRFETFWSSEDHSLLVFDELENEIKKISPKELEKNPKGKYLIQEE